MHRRTVALQEEGAHAPVGEEGAGRSDGAAEEEDALFGTAGDTPKQEQEQAEDDPAINMATLWAEAEMMNIAVFRNTSEWKDEVASSVYPSSKPIVVIDMPTSRADAIMANLQIPVPKQFCTQF